MADIGRLAGVSASTVSRALSNNPSIPKATRDRIARIADENNYVLDVRAQNFRLQRSQTIATVLPYVGRSRRHISDPFYMEMVGGIADELEAHGYDMIVARVPSDRDAWCLRYIMNKRVDGIFIIDRAVNDRGIARLQELGANFIVFGPTLPDQDYVSVGGNTMEGGMLATRHLASLGRRHIGFIGGHKTMVETYLRHEGYRRALGECGLPYDERLVIYTDFTPQAGATAITQLLDNAPDLDGVFICSDFMSIAAMQIMAERGRRVPQDISVVGYDDIQLAAHCSPRLTTVRQQINASGRMMVRKLFDMLDGGIQQPETIPVELIVRDSCGANILSSSTQSA
jgi:DNA-binding LacI/PurR family transcriptional regulator